MGFNGSKFRKNKINAISFFATKEHWSLELFSPSHYTFDWITWTAFRWLLFFVFLFFSCRLEKWRKMPKLLLNKLKRKMWIWRHNLWSISRNDCMLKNVVFHWYAMIDPKACICDIQSGDYIFLSLSLFWVITFWMVCDHVIWANSNQLLTSFTLFTSMTFGQWLHSVRLIAPNGIEPVQNKHTKSSL